jgi:hypothetical protein
MNANVLTTLPYKQKALFKKELFCRGWGIDANRYGLKNIFYQAIIL